MYDLNKIKEYLNTTFIGDTLMQFDDLTSAAVKAKNIFDTCPDGTVILTENQTRCKVRFGREWKCIPDKNIYLSIIIKNNEESSSIYEIISLVSALEAIKQTINCNIKWPNDLLVNNKKIGSTAIEAVNKKNNNGFIISFFINVNTNIDEIDDELKEEATSIIEESGSVIEREFLISDILNYFEKYYKEYLDIGSISNIIDIYRGGLDNSKQIQVLRHGKKTKRSGLIKDIDEEGNLVILNERGLEEILKSGEVIIKYER